MMNWMRGLRPSLLPYDLCPHCEAKHGDVGVGAYSTNEATRRLMADLPGKVRVQCLRCRRKADEVGAP